MACLTLVCGFAVTDHRTERCWLQGRLGDALHTLSCAAGYNIRWLLRAIVRLGPKLFFLHPLILAVIARLRVKQVLASLQAALTHDLSPTQRNGRHRPRHAR